MGHAPHRIAGMSTEVVWDGEAITGTIQIVRLGKFAEILLEAEEPIRQKLRGVSAHTEFLQPASAPQSKSEIPPPALPCRLRSLGV